METLGTNVVDNSTGLVAPNFSASSRDNASQQTLLEATTVSGHGRHAAKFYSLEHLITTSVVLGLLILATIIGNVFVIAAVLLEKNLHNVANYLILSLAVADLMVASLVMPLSAVNEISQVWFLRPEICDMWISFDVLCCTASILHLVAIAVDRYWAVTSIEYIRNRSSKRIFTMIIVVWIVALCISIPPLFGWKDTSLNPITGVCIISQDLGYTVFSTLGAFYLPMLGMIIIYIRIYQVARARIRKENFGKKKNKKKKLLGESTTTNLLPPPSVSECNNYSCATETSTNDNNCNAKLRPSVDVKVSNGHVDEAQVNMLPTETPDDLAKNRLRQKEKLEIRRERKAARTLAIITGAFMICWLPFFIIALIAPFFRECISIPPLVESIVLWLGYMNSLLNPIIYTIFSPDFRNAFQKILFGKYRRSSRKSGY